MNMTIEITLEKPHEQGQYPRDLLQVRQEIEIDTLLHAQDIALQITELAEDLKTKLVLSYAAGCVVGSTH